MNNNRLRFLYYGVITYMLLASTWWSFLLFTKNREAYEARKQLYEYNLDAEAEQHGEQSTYYYSLVEQQEKLYKDYRRQESMIIGEGIAFIVILMVGVYLIIRGYRNQVILARQARNFLLATTHELKSPLASIKLVLQTFLKRDLSPKQINAFSGNALNELARLENLVENLLLSAKLEKSYYIDSQDVDLPILIYDLVSEMEDKHKHVQLTVDECGTIPTIQGDANALNTVLLNLIENAIKYSKEERPEIGLKLCHIDELVEVDVSDNGIGISDEDKERVFQKFYRAGNEDTRDTKGTGLGLYIVQKLIRAHYGTITVKDNHPKGSVFQIRLPIERE